MHGGADLLGGSLAFEVLVYEAKGNKTQLLQQHWTGPGYDAVKEKVHRRRAEQGYCGKNIMWDAISVSKKVYRVVH